MYLIYQLNKNKGGSSNNIEANRKNNILGNIHLNHLLYGIFAKVSAPIVTPLVGIIRLVKPSPNWKVSTAICLLIPETSQIGIIIGIVKDACPDPEGIKKFKKDWKKNIHCAEITGAVFWVIDKYVMSLKKKKNLILTG